MRLHLCESNMTAGSEGENFFVLRKIPGFYDTYRKSRLNLLYHLTRRPLGLALFYAKFNLANSWAWGNYFVPQLIQFRYKCLLLAFSLSYHSISQLPSKFSGKVVYCSICVQLRLCAWHCVHLLCKSEGEATFGHGYPPF